MENQYHSPINVPTQHLLQQSQQQSNSLPPALIIPPPPIFNLPPPEIKNYSYTLYFERRHIMLINGQQQYASETDQMSVKHQVKFKNSEKYANQNISVGGTFLSQRSNRKLIKNVQYNKIVQMLTVPQLGTQDGNKPAYDISCKYYFRKFVSRGQVQFVKLNVTHVVNAASQLNNHFEKEGVEYIKLELFDNMHQDVIQPCLKAAEFIKTAIDKGGKVFVHCAMGKSRSVSAILIYLIKYHGLSLKESYDLVKSKRSIIRPNSNYMKQLQKFQKQLKNFTELINQS